MIIFNQIRTIQKETVDEFVRAIEEHKTNLKKQTCYMHRKSNSTNCKIGNQSKNSVASIKMNSLNWTIFIYTISSFQFHNIIKNTILCMHHSCIRVFLFENK